MLEYLDLRSELLCSQKLSDECMAYVKRLMREAARDYRMDARLSKECDEDVSMLILRRSGVKWERRQEGRVREEMCQD